MKRCVWAVARKIVPDDGKGGVDAFRKSRVEDRKLKGSIEKGIRVSRHGSVERRTLMKLMSAHVPGMEVKKLLRNISEVRAVT